jgi:riboflavin synthase
MLGSENMFTGIVEEIGTILSVKKGVKSSALTISGDLIFEDMHIGDSIAVNGVCLTVTNKTKESFTADVMAETLRRSSLGSLKAGSKVNLERAMAANGRFGGHIVSGHIDGTGEIESFVREDNAVWVTVKTPVKLLKYIIEKGSIAIDGVSLTVAYVDKRCFKVSLIPHTAANTILLSKKAGDIVNLENDIVGKYIEKLMHFDEQVEEDTKTTGISMDFLAKNGFA